MHTSHMNKPDLSKIMADYTASYSAERKRSLEAQKDPQAWFAKWEAMRPQGQFGTWHISDRD